MTHEHGDRTVITSVEKLSADEEAKRAYLLFLTGPLVGKIHLLEAGTTSIGRGQDVDIAIADSRISRHHVTLHVQDNDVGIEDLGSTNGTYVNGKRIQGLTPLKDGDKVQLSTNSIFKFAWQDKTENVFHKELYKMAVLDPVTTLFNRRYYMERFAEEFSMAKRNNSSLSVLMMDIDHFKSVNDTYGHLAGDLVLQQVAEVLRNMMRHEDLVARYGGEEFVVMLRGIYDKGAILTAERIRKKIEDTAMTFEGKTIPVTISIGAATFDPSVTSPEDFLRIADERLYYSKQHGRNRVTHVIPSIDSAR